MLIIQQLEEMKDLSINEKEVAKYIIHHQSVINKININDISKETYTSPSTTVRLSKKLGFKGWKELKAALIDELKYIKEHFQNIEPNYPFSSKDSVMDISYKIGNLMADTIYDTMNLLDYDTLTKAVQLLKNADTIYVYGITNAIAMTYDFKYSMRTIGKKVIIVENNEEFQYCVFSTKKTDVSLFISYSGENLDLLKFARELKGKGNIIISITSIGNNTLSRLSDLTLNMTTREKLYSKINNYTSKESTNYILNILFSCVFAANYEKNLSIKMSLSRKIDTKRSSYLELLKED